MLFVVKVICGWIQQQGEGFCVVRKRAVKQLCNLTTYQLLLGRSIVLTLAVKLFFCSLVLVKIL